MKRFKIFTILSVVFFTTILSGASVQATDANNFRISDFTIDYYISRNTDGTSKLEVIEEITAIFPDYDQNHGIYRIIPTSVAGGGVRTMDDIDSLRVYRNGQPEDVTYDFENRAYVLQIGNADTYVHGEQRYTIEYEQHDIILDHTEFDLLNANVDHPATDAWQEFYWDTNGTGWKQTVEYLTVNIHIDSELLEDTQDHYACFVGERGSLEQKRCNTIKNSDGFTFTTNKVLPEETMTILIVFNPGTFITPVPQVNYAMVAIVAIILGSGLALLIFTFYKRSQISDKIRFYKGLPVPPQYTPLKGYTVAELNATSLKPNAAPATAIMLELAVNHKIEVIKGDKKKFSNKHHWKIKVKNLTNLSPEQLTVLKLINDGDAPSVDEEIEIKTRSSNAVLHQLTQDITTQPVETLEKRGDRIKITKGGHIVGALTTIWMFLSFAAMIIYINIEEHIYAVSFGGPLLFAAAMIFIAIVLTIAYSTQTKITNYSSRSQDGLLHANYLEGMKLYIKMAEKDRLAFLQSVDGADTSTKGIVKLYEKLLPYAALFGMEKSWSNELAHYYEQEPDLSPVWYAGSMAAFSSMDFHSAIGDISSSIQSSTFSSSGSGFSGGAGGGGGGGGGGGW